MIVRVTGTNGEIYSTTDGGQNWQVQTVLPNGDFTDVYFLNEKPVGSWVTLAVKEIADSMKLMTEVSPGPTIKSPMSK
jgi:hypothetical protein